MEISLQELLTPVPGYELWDYLAYAIFAFSLIGMLASGGEINPMISILMAVIMVGAIIEKTYALGYIFGPANQTHEFYVQEHLNQFWSMLIRAGMFAFSIVAVVQSTKKATRGPALLLVLLTLIYGLGRWYDSQRGAISGIGFIMTEPHTAVAQGSVGVLLLVDSAYRGYCRWLRRIYRH